MDKKYLTVAEVAERLRKPIKTVSTWIARRQLPHVRLGPRSVVVDSNELVLWEQARRVPVGEPNLRLIKGNSSGDRDAS